MLRHSNISTTTSTSISVVTISVSGSSVTAGGGSGGSVSSVSSVSRILALRVPCLGITELNLRDEHKIRGIQRQMVKKKNPT